MAPGPGPAQSLRLKKIAPYWLKFIYPLSGTPRHAPPSPLTKKFSRGLKLFEPNWRKFEIPVANASRQGAREHEPGYARGPAHASRISTGAPPAHRVTGVGLAYSMDVTRYRFFQVERDIHWLPARPKLGRSEKRGTGELRYIASA